jgi:hypothetical protein
MLLHPFIFLASGPVCISGVHIWLILTKAYRALAYQATARSLILELIPTRAPHAPLNPLI